MIINKITLKNFYRFGNKEQELNLSGTGITAITGFNGYGKSSCIIDSLLFGFFGKARDSVDGVVNRYVGEGCKIGIEFTVGDKTYKVFRYRKHTTHKNNVYLFEGDIDKSGHTAAETNAKILDLIQMNYISFTNSSVFSSELYSAFLANKVSERLVIFENILSLKEINAFYVEIKKILKELSDGREKKNLVYTSALAEINTIKNTVETYTRNAKQKLIEAKNKKDQLLIEIAACNKRIEEYSIVNVEEELEKLSNNNRKQDLKEKILKLESEKKTLTIPEPVDELRIVDKYKDIDFEKNKIKEEKYKEDLETIKTRENGYKLSYETISSLKEKINSKNIILGSNLNELNNLGEKILKLKEAKCPFCGQHLASEKAQDELNKAQKRSNEILEENQDLKDEIEKMQSSLAEEQENYNWLISDANRIKDSLDKNFIPNSDLVYEQFKNASKKLNEVQQQKSMYAARLEQIEKEITSLNEDISNLKLTTYTKEELESISQKIENEKIIISDKEKEITLIEGSAKSIYDKSYVESLNKNAGEKETTNNSLKEEIDKIDYKIKHYEYLGECFSNKSGGFKKYFIGEMIDLFNTKINQYLPFFFSENVKITFDKDLNDTITMDDFEVSFSSFSQGQRQRAELAISFALFDVARVFFSNDNKLLILDEMDKGLDRLGIKAMMNLLRGFDSQLRIFIVSHNPLIEDEIDSKVKITRDENRFSLICQE